MKNPITKFAAMRANAGFSENAASIAAQPRKSCRNPKPKKRDNIFSKSRDLREDRGTREMKTSHNDQTNHAR